jgi:hypothetical protein
MIDPDQRPWRVPVRSALSLALLAVGTLAWKGYRFGGSNQSLQVPLLRHLVDPGLYARDPVLASFDGYPSYFFPALAPLVRWAGIQPVYFVLYLIAHAAALAAVLDLGRRLFDSRTAGLLAALLYVGAVPALGAEMTYWPRLTHAHVATALVLWAFALYLRDRRFAAFMLLGIAFDLHALYAGTAVVLLATDAAWRGRERGARRLALDAGAFLVMALPTLVWIVRRHDPVAAEVWPQWLDVMRARSGPHTFPFSVPTAVHARYLLLLSVGALGWSAVPERERSPAIMRFALATAGLVLVGLIFSEYWPLRRVIEAQLLRGTKWLTVFVLLYIARLVMISWEWGGLARGAATAVFAGLLLQQPAWLALGLTLYLLAAGSRVAAPALVVGGAALVMAALTGAAPMPERLGLQQVVLALEAVLERPAVVACLVGFVVLRAAGDVRKLPQRLLVLTTGVAVVAALGLTYRENLASVAAEPWNQVQLWVRDHTPRDAVILTPPHREGFRVLSERAVVGEWKDGTQQFFSWAFTRDWEARMKDVGGGETPVYDGFGPDRIVELAHKYGAEYAVVPAANALGDGRVYANEEFAVYRVPPVGALAPER